MELVQMYVGSEINFWELPFRAYGSLAPPSWVRHTWESMSGTLLTLKGPNLAIPRRRQYDVYLMDAFVNSDFPKETLFCLNECRLFLHATTLADLTTANGTAIDANI